MTFEIKGGSLDGATVELSLPPKPNPTNIPIWENSGGRTESGRIIEIYILDLVHKTATFKKYRKANELQT